MPYAPDATDTAQPADAGVKASTAAAEFRTLKAYIKNTLLAGAATWTGTPSFQTQAAADNSLKAATTAFVQQEITRLTGLVVNSGGNVGIGTSSPTAKLVVQQANNTGDGLRIVMSGSDSMLASRYLSLSDVWQISATYNTTGAYKPLTLWTGDAERMRIDASGGVGIGGSAHASAALDVQSTTRGLRLPNMTTTQKNAIASPAPGLVVFDTTLAKACLYTGAAWQTITSA